MIVRRGAAEIGADVTDEIVADRAPRRSDARTQHLLASGNNNMAEGQSLGPVQIKRCRAQAAARLRQGRRRALRLHLGVHQVDARLGSRRVRLLPRGDARGRRRSTHHRLRRFGLRSDRARRQTGAAVVTRSPPHRRSSTSAFRRPGSTSRRRRSTLPSRRSRTLSSRRSAKRRRTCASSDTPRPPDELRDTHYFGAKKPGRGEGYIWPTPTPAGSRSITCPGR